MTAFVEEQLMANGRWEVSCDWDPEVHAEFVDPATRKLKKWLHALVYDADDNLICPPLVLLTKDADEDGIVLGGCHIIWWEGSGDVGPLIVDRKYASGKTRLSDGGFELGGLHWRFPQDTTWVVVPTPGARTGGFYVVHANPPPADEMLDDVIQAEDVVTDCVPGELWTAGAYVKSGVTFGGRIRIRVVYEGRFMTTNIGSANDDWPPSATGDIADGSDPLSVITGDVFEIISGFGNLIPNGSFESGLTSWFQGAGTWTVDNVGGSWDGTGHALTSDVTGFKWLQSSASGNTTPVTMQPVTAGEEYQVFVLVRSSGGVDGEVWLNVGLVDGSFAVVGYEDTEHLTPDAASGGAWRVLSKRITVPEGIEGLVPTLIVMGQSVAGQWDFDVASLLRTKGNIDFRLGGVFGVTPQRSYTWRLPFRSEPGVTGTVQMRLACYAPDRPDIILQGPTLEATEGVAQTASWSFKTPSGYGTVQQMLWSADVQGGSYYLGEGTVTDDDDTTRVLDGIGPDAASATSYTLVESYGAVPEGTERLRVELIAETFAGVWSVDDVSLIHVDITPMTSAGVVNSLLVDPDTGDPLPVTAGTIVGPEDIASDWHIYNLHNREALEHFSRVIADPPREWRVNTDRSLDWDTAANLFVDHLPDTDEEIILLPSDIDVEANPSVSEDSTDRATRIRLIGAERVATSGQHVLIAASADVAGTEVDWNGNAANRTLLVEDSTVDHLAYAQAFADDQAAAMADPEQSITATLTGIGTRPAFEVGDWIYVYDPEGGLVDPDNPATVDGETVWPVRKRVLGRTRKLGPSHRIEIRRLDGSTFDLPGVHWEDEDATTLELGERRPEFLADPQGGDIGKQYLRFRASSPR